MNNKTNYEYLLSDLSSLKGVGEKTKNLLKKKNINNLFDLMVEKSSNMATLFANLDAKDITNTSVVKLWIKEDGCVVNFSRKIDDKHDIDKAKKHLGIYAYRASFLKQFVKWPQSERELDTQLEQMRAMDSNIPIGVTYVPEVPISVDTKEDLINIETNIREHNDKS